MTNNLGWIRKEVLGDNTNNGAEFTTEARDALTEVKEDIDFSLSHLSRTSHTSRFKQ